MILAYVGVTVNPAQLTYNPFRGLLAILRKTSAITL